MSQVVGTILLALLILVAILLVCIVVAGSYVVWFNQRVGNYIGLSGSIQTHVVQLGDHKTSCKILFGTSSTKPPVVLIGSCPLDQRMWDPVLNEIQKMISNKNPDIPTVITYDSRGCGTADFPTNEETLSIEKWSKDLGDLLNHFNVDKICLAGWGFGGLVAQHFALTNTDTVAKLYVFSMASTEQGINDDTASDLTSLIEQLQTWRQANSLVTYLTLHETMVQGILCKWFTSATKCGSALKSLGVGYEEDEGESDVFEMCQDMLREVSVDDYINTLKMVRDSHWLLKMWESSTSKFKVYLMAASNDRFAHPAGVIDLFNSMKHRNRGKWVTMDVKQGLHGYPLAHADETALELVTF